MVRSLTTHMMPPRSSRPFNSPLECGLRLLFLLDAAKQKPADLQRLVSYDYLLVHSGDVVGGPPSLHPSVPFRGTELLVKRDLVSAGLSAMFSRELLRKTFDTSGILFQGTELTHAFLQLLKTTYARDLHNRASWVISIFGNMADHELSAYTSSNIGRWGVEFDRFSSADELEL